MINTICCSSLMNGTRRYAIAPRILALLLLMVFPLLAGKQSDPLPKAKTLFENFIQKTGGQAAYDRILSRLTKSVMQMSVPAMTAEVTSRLTRSGPYHVVVDSPMGKIEYGSDGQTVWESNPMTGSRIREGRERLRFLSLYGLDLPARWRQAFKKVICTGKEAIDGKSVFRVEALTGADFQLTYYFDQTSGLLVKIELPLETMAGQGIQEILLGDYRRVDGILFPHSQVRKEAGREMIITIKSVTHNVEIPANEFALPEAVRKIAGSGQ
ncbi:MAG: DUF620 domain-containing protein [Candidatus Aminicenantes bacterium]|nr:DUF620 domain-containing protein [Candidatus Aminicenantes bacterium]